MIENVSIALIEDEEAVAKTEIDFLNRYAYERGLSFTIKHFKDGISFLEGYKAEYDIILMDIQLPDYNGIEAAKKVRRVDQNTVLIFITNMANLAINCYEVDALDFIVKPIEYFSFSVKFGRAISRVEQAYKSNIYVTTSQGVVKLSASVIKYIEVMGHTLVYHTTEGNYEGYGSLNKVEQALKEMGFARCNSCYLANLRYVKRIEGFTVFIGKEEESVAISHSKKKGFIKALNEYIGAGNIYVL